MARWQARSLWMETAPPAAAPPRLDGQVRAELAVVGAGYTGLSAALHASAAGRDTVVLEALELGAGASGLNGGQVIPGVKHDPDVLESLYGASLGPRVVATVARAADLVFELIERHRIECEAQRSGWLQPALAARDLPSLERRVREWRSRGADVEVLDEKTMARLTGSERYVGGWIDRRAGTVQPLGYLRGLARAAAEAGARIYAHSRAERLRRTGTGWELTTASGAVQAERVIIATGAYSGALIPRLARSVVTVPSFQVATDPLPPALLATILPQRQAVSDLAHLLRYFRLDAAGRLVLGTRGFFSDVPLQKAVSPHHRAIADIFPQLGEQTFKYYWGGLVAMTPDHLPHLHEIEPNLTAALGYNGRGVAMATMLGRLLAQLALGRPSADLDYPVSPLRPLPLHRFNRVGARAMVQYLRMLDHVQSRRARRPRSPG